MENKWSKNRIYLVGFMGAGKTTYGRLLANKLGFKFFDTDKKFEEKYKTTVDLFFKKYGEEAFRKIEYEMIISTFELDNIVVSTGGGTPCFFDTMKQINDHGISVYLQLPAKALYNRLVYAKKLRPLVAKKSDRELLGFIENKLEEREPFYRQARYIVSGMSVDIDFITKIIKESS